MKLELSDIEASFFFSQTRTAIGLWAFIMWLGFSACQNSSPSSQEDIDTQAPIIIATAANMQFAMEALVKEFSQKTSIPCELVISSSGKLTAQIIQGAPYDVFVAANLTYPQKVFDEGKAVGPPQVYAYGKLVLWAANEGVPLELDSLMSPRIQHIAIANPKTAPYGEAAMALLEHYDLVEKVKAKLVYGESVAQINQFVSSGMAQIGFTAKAVVLSPNMSGEGSWIELKETTYSPIEQGVIQVKRKGMKELQAGVFVQFLFSDEAQEILASFGYRVDQE